MVKQSVWAGIEQPSSKPGAVATLVGLAMFGDATVHADPHGGWPSRTNRP
jgi:hypothetical protein